MRFNSLLGASLLASTVSGAIDVPQYTSDEIAACFTGLNALSQGANGLYWPGTTEYEFARQGNNAKSIDFMPQAIVAVHAETDIQAAVRCAKVLALPVGVQAGGHSYEIGYGSSGLMLYLSPYNSVTDIYFTNANDRDGPNHPWLVFQSGTRNARLYGSLLTACSAPSNPYGCNFLLSSGTYFDVGSGGHAICGGYGNYGRSLGLLADQVEEYVVIIGDGSRVVANHNLNSDLFWALRGGCSSSLGIVSTLKIRLHYHAVGLTTHISFRPTPEQRALCLEYGARCGPYLDDRYSVINNIEKGTLAGIFMGSLEEARAALVGVPCGIDELASALGIRNVVIGNFREKTVYDSIMNEFASSSSYKNESVTSLESMLELKEKGPPGGRYFMHDLVFQKPMPMEIAKSFVKWLDDGVIDSFGFKARNGNSSRVRDDLAVYTDDFYGPSWRGILYEIHIGVSSGNFRKDNGARLLLESVYDVLRPYMLEDVAYPGYMYFAGSTVPTGAYYFGAANVEKLKAVRLKYDPENILANRVGAHMYPVPKDHALLDYEGELITKPITPEYKIIPRIITPEEDAAIYSQSSALESRVLNAVAVFAGLFGLAFYLSSLDI